LYKCKPLVIVVVLVIVVLVDVLVLVAAVVLVDVLVIIAAVVLVVIAISREVWREVKWVPSGLNCCEKWPQSIRKKKGGFPIFIESGLGFYPSTFNTYVQVKNIRNTISGLDLGVLPLFFLCRVLFF
jgi:hypothetical protein